MNNQAKQKPVPQVVVSRVINASPEALFDAWTQPALMQQWFFPAGWHAVSSNDLRVGGKYSHDMIGNSKDATCTTEIEASNSAHYLHTGEYLVIERPKKLVFTWNSPSVQNTQVTVEFRAVGKSTEVIVTHEFLESEKNRTEHTQGWNMCLENLIEHVAKH